MDKITIGTCSECGGAVCILKNWMGLQPQVPTCTSCGATMENHGPVIPMKPKPKISRAIESARNMKELQDNVNDFLKEEEILGFPKSQLFHASSPPNSEAVELAGGGWGLKIKDSFPL